MDDFEQFKTSPAEVIAEVVETGELELKVELEDVTESLQSYDKTWTDEELLHNDEQRNGILSQNLLLMGML